MKKLFSLLPIILSITTLSGCKKEERKEINVFAAASLTETLNSIKEKYEEKNKNVKLVFNFESSGTLQKQIQNGATCDLFISAAQKQMNALQEANLLINETRINLLENKVTLAVPKNNPKNVTDFDNLASRLSAKEEGFVLGMGNQDVPVGQYTQKILQYYNLIEVELASAHMINYGSNVKAVTSLIDNAAVACGVIYATDAYSAKLDVVATATKEMCGQIIYPASLISGSKLVDETKSFLSYLQEDEAMEIFKSVGFVKA